MIPIEDDPNAVCMHDLHPVSCTICIYGVRARNRGKRRTKGFPAAYPGTCTVNGDRIEQGERITSYYDGFAHVECVD